MSISIIVPFYNEENCIKECLERTKKVFEKTDYEIIAVNDGSRDNSHNIVSKITKKDPKLKYIFHPENKGYSYAIRQGIKNSQKEYVSFIDADLQYPPKELLKMYNYARKNNLQFVIGIPKTKYYSLTRKIVSFIYNTFVYFLFNIKLKDVNSLKLMRRRYLKNINFQFDYGMIEIETLLGFKMQGIAINTYPINVQGRKGGKSKFSIKLIYRTIRDCFKLRFSKDNLIK